MTKKTKKTIIGLDEAGRGPLAGPVVAAAVKIKDPLIKKREIYSPLADLFLELPPEKEENLSRFRDSKKLSPQKRKNIYCALATCPGVEWGVGVASVKEIDKLNILRATKIAMLRALSFFQEENLLLFIDGNFKIGTRHEEESISRGDEKILECALASIIAKVERDEMMENCHLADSRYGFHEHKGYGTRRHREMIKKYGKSQIHRITFKG